MTTYIALLRGVNVSGQHILPMATLKNLLTVAGFENVTTYIQSGNIIFNTAETEKAKIGKVISGIIENNLGFNPTTIVLTRQDLLQFLQENPFLKETDFDPKQLYFTFLETSPQEELLQKIKTLDFSPDRFIISNHIIYVNCPNGYGKTKINNQFFEQKLKVNATTRNLNTVKRLLELAE